MLLQAKAAEADVQEWHEGLREYPDLSLAPPLRRQQFRARNREIRGRVLARCGGLQTLHLAENKVDPRLQTPNSCTVPNVIIVAIVVTVGNNIPALCICGNMVVLSKHYA